MKKYRLIKIIINNKLLGFYVEERDYFALMAQLPHGWQHLTVYLESKQKTHLALNWDLIPCIDFAVNEEVLEME